MADVALRDECMTLLVAGQVRLCNCLQYVCRR